MNEPESYGPEGGHMGITLRQTEIDLEDTGALASRYQAALEEAYRCLRAAGYVPRQPGESIWVTKDKAAADVIYRALHPD